MANLPLITWDEVPEDGPVFYRLKGSSGRWFSDIKRDGVLRGMPHLSLGGLEFCAAEQQPGEWAASLATSREACRYLDTVVVEGRRKLEAKDATLTRLRDDLATLERTIRATSAADRGDGSASSGTLQRWADRLAALREGK